MAENQWLKLRCMGEWHRGLFAFSSAQNTCSCIMNTCLISTIMKYRHFWRDRDIEKEFNVNQLIRNHLLGATKETSTKKESFGLWQRESSVQDWICGQFHRLLCINYDDLETCCVTHPVQWKCMTYMTGIMKYQSQYNWIFEWEQY